ncbi:MAG: ferredoxin [Desulforhopalus sp.]|jgi:ferredoxin
MQNEFFYLSVENELHDLGAGFDVSKNISGQNYLVSNCSESKSEMYAPEVNFYWKNSQDPEGLKVENLRKLYKARATRFESAQDVESSVRVGKKVAITASTQTDIAERLKDLGYEVIEVAFDSLSCVRGTLGKFTIAVNNDGQDTEVSVDHIVSTPQNGTAQDIIGMYDLEALGHEETIKQIQANSGIFRYKNGVTSDWSKCLQKGKRVDVCGKCISVCPQKAISWLGEELRVEVSHIQCVACGACVSICPTGALDYAQLPRDAFSALDITYIGSISLIVRENQLPDGEDFDLPAKVLPLAVEGIGFLDEDYLISLIHSSEYPVLIYDSEFTPHQKDCVDLVNNIFKKVYNVQVVYLCEDNQQISDAASSCSRLLFAVGSSEQSGLTKRERIASRLVDMIADGDFGTLEPGKNTPYGTIAIHSETCTLCLSCVEACTVGALTPHAEDNTLRFTPSSCVQCGHCQHICPEENCLTVVYNQLELNGAYFSDKVMAQDELFACIECGEKFAPAKSISKIVTMMTPAFGEDSLRIRSLSCCPDCKAKVMLEDIAADI